MSQVEPLDSENSSAKAREQVSRVVCVWQRDTGEAEATVGWLVPGSVITV